MKKNSPANFAENIIHLFLRVTLWIYICIIRISQKKISQKPFPKKGPVEILITGTFSSDNWIIALLHPIALSSRCGRIRMVAVTPVPIIKKVEAIYPPKLLMTLIGKTPARLVTFLWVGYFTRPDIVGGLHLLLNGLTAIMLAKLTGAISLYNCCGGPAECIGGGAISNTPLFCKLHSPDPYIEHFLLEAIRAADIIITRGNSAINFFKDHNIKSRIHIIPGGMDSNIFFPKKKKLDYDLIIIGRLTQVKRIELFLQIINKLHTYQPNLKAVILGDGPLKKSLENQARELNILDIVHFAGHQKNVADWLQQSKLFILTSESEGLSQAMIQAMMCGLPVVVSHVGEAEELVQDGVNGFLIRDLDIDAFVKAIILILENQTMLNDFSKAARKSSEICDIYYLAQKWDNIFNELA